MNPLMLMAGISFLTGMFGYIIVKYWILPIRAYLKIKQQTFSLLDSLASRLQTSAPESLETERTLARQMASALTDAYTFDLPAWYKIKINSRSESPLDAAQQLMKLSGMHANQEMIAKINKIKEFLRPA